MQEAINRYLVLPVFTLLGAVLPWEAWGQLGWRAPVLVVAVLALRRLPLLMVIGRRVSLRPAEAAFVGWFGPVGIAILYYLTRAHAQGALDETVWAAGTLIIAASTILHGATTPLAVGSSSRPRAAETRSFVRSSWCTCAAVTTARLGRHCSPRRSARGRHADGSRVQPIDRADLNAR